MRSYVVISLCLLTSTPLLADEPSILFEKKLDGRELEVLGPDRGEYVEIDALINSSKSLPSLAEMIKDGVFSKEEAEKIAKLQDAQTAMILAKSKAQEALKKHQQRKTMDMDGGRSAELQAKVDAASRRIAALDEKLKYFETQGHYRVIEKEKSKNGQVQAQNAKMISDYNRGVAEVFSNTLKSAHEAQKTDLTNKPTDLLNISDD